MKRSDFQFELPERQVAQVPLPGRSDSRLLKLNRHTGEVHDLQFRDLPGLLEPGDLLVRNNTRVIPARMFARKETGGRVEIMLERLTSETRCIAQLRSGKSPRAGTRLVLENDAVVLVTGRQDSFFTLELAAGKGNLADQVKQTGHMPLPPYIQREDRPEDRERYQTVYAKTPGAVAAPTAGLHFDAALFEKLERRGVESTEVTLHVGAGTFQPVRVERLQDHRMHAEYLEIDEACCNAIRAAKQRGSRVIAVGTTAVRSIETAAQNSPPESGITAYRGDSRLFIYPGFEFRVIDGMITNFHLPESTLLMLVCAFAGTRETLAAYRHAIDRDYRFFSYGDAMLVA
jgi:S-adenosylmethionine:tRNA ribosyltransferase-isomerase